LSSRAARWSTSYRRWRTRPYTTDRPIQPHTSPLHSTSWQLAQAEEEAGEEEAGEEEAGEAGEAEAEEEEAEEEEPQAAAEEAEPHAEEEPQCTTEAARRSEAEQM
jgi:hypothetical protein